MSWHRSLIIFLSGILIFSSLFVGRVLLAATSTTDGQASTTLTLSQDDAPSSEDEAEKLKLEFEIRRKNAELEAINLAIEKNKEALSKTSDQKASLQKELSTLQRQQTILTQQIKQDQVSLERLGLEIKSLTYNLQDIQEAIVDKKRAIEELFRVMQRTENISILAIILQSNSLSEAINEVKDLFDVNARLTLDIQNLKRLNVEYDGKLKDLNTKQAEVVNQTFNLKNRKVILASQESQQQVLLKETKNQEAVYQAHLKEVYAQQEMIAAEIEALDAKLRGEINYEKLPDSGKLLIMPIANTTITQGYGATSFAKSGYRGKWHNGLDLRASIGTPVLAASDGEIEAIGDQDRYCPRGAYGKFLVIRHKNNLTTLYGHLSRVVVSPGDSVKQGQTIGYSGSTGYATGPHLHFTVFAQETFKMGGSRSCGPMPQGGDLNPLKYL